MVMKDETRNTGGEVDIILLAEDSEKDVFLLRRSFETAKVAVSLQVVKDGMQVMAYLKGEGVYANREQHPMPDLLLIDLKMPRLDGFDVLSLIRQQPGLNDLQIVMLTASDYTRDAQMAYALGVTSFVVKPMDPDHAVSLCQSLHDLCAGARKNRHTASSAEPMTPPKPGKA